MATFFQEDDILGKAYDARIMRRLLTYVRPYMRLVIAALLLLVLFSLIDLIGPALTGYAIDQYIAPKTQSLSLSARGNGLLLIAGIYLLVLTVGMALRYLHVFILNVMGQRIMLDMRSQMFDHLQRLALAFFDHNPVGRLMTRLTNDVDSLNEMFTSGAISILSDVLTIVGVTVVLLVINWYGGGRVLIGALSLGALVAYLQYVDRFFLPIRDLAEKYNILQSAMASSERIFKVIDEPIMIQDAPETKKFDEVKGEIEFRDVWFAYNPGEWVLKGISLKIRPGERVALVGATGAGKTSIISLISRFYDVQKGAILIDGIDIREVRQKELRRHVGTVLQDPFIFSGTVASNIRLHDEDISDERMHEAAEYVNAAHFIEQLPHGYSQEVRERGAGLSVGQKQLLAFARAIAFNPEILLILDEATSSVDTETEVLIQDALNKLMTNRTSIIIAHRLSTIRNVDRIIVLHKGRIVEEGSHEELLNRHGVYHRLYEYQYAQ